MGTRRKKERRRQKEARLESARRMLENSAALPPGASFSLEDSPQKMSAILMEYAEPLFEHTADEDQVYTLAMMSWNAAFLPKQEVGGALDRIVREMAGDDAKAQAALRYLLASMLLRKLERYPDVRRLFLGYEFTGTGEERALNVLSAPVSPP